MGWRKAKPFPCIICGKDFDKQSQLRKHVKDAHGIEFNQYVKQQEEKLNGTITTEK